MYVKVINYTAPQAAQEFARSLRDTGFAVLINHPISQSLVNAVYEDWKNFFANDAKFNYLFLPDEIPQRGYFPFKSESAKYHSIKDLKEYYHYRDENDLPREMGNSTEFFLQDMTKLGTEVLQWIETNLPKDIFNALSMPLSQMIHKSDTSVIRCLHYPPLTEGGTENSVRAAAHEDIDLLTILPAATAPGLQVLDREGNWHEVPCDSGMLIFNGGDMLQEATKGYYKSTTHKVVNPAGEFAHKPRYSLTLFLQPRKDVRLSEAHTAESYFAERFRENGLKPAA
ncbi:MAG: isopenicillin N synthase family oxygenase [Alphaproteobacteria bacterium]|nr:isopenicillin N synthase family oxygenase [Alphaproteobacteria bacterium]